MNFADLLAELGARGIQLRRNGDALSIRGSKGPLDAAHVEALRAWKADLLACVDSELDGWWTPPAVITPAMLSLVDLSQADIDRIAGSVPGGAANIQDIYPLAPLQEGILFHHMMSSDSDAYVMADLLAFDSRARLDDYLAAMQAVVDRHDILRTAVLWESLPEPVQVVWRKAPLEVREVTLMEDGSDPVDQLFARFDMRRFRIDVRKAPMLRPLIASDSARNRWLLMDFHHHITTDHTTREVLREEIKAHLQGRQADLPAPVPFRNLVAQTRLGVAKEEHEAFFTKMLGDVFEPTAPFGLLEVRGDGSETKEDVRDLDIRTARQLREQAQRLGISTASLFHLAWALVLARVCGREDVVFGTVVFGRMQGGEGADRAMGLFINTLPLRVQVGDEGLEACARKVHVLLADLMRHEHASLVLAQSCSGVRAPAPLFSALLNYRHDQDAALDVINEAIEGVELLRALDYTSYPFSLSVDDNGTGFRFTAQVQNPYEPSQLNDFMQCALEQLTLALETSPSRALRSLDVLPEGERRKLVTGWNATDTVFPTDVCIHELFEAQVCRTPDARAVAFADESMSYQALNRRANQLAHRLRSEGIGSGSVVGICVERSFEAIVGLLAILKAGGVYVPLDPAYPPDRLAFMLEDAGATVLLTQEQLLPQVASISMKMLCLDQDLGLGNEPDGDQQRFTPPDALAYVIYTSGSTGKPKGVMISHRAACNTLHDINARFAVGSDDSILALSSLAFDLSVYDVFGMLGAGGTVVIPPPSRVADVLAWQQVVRQQKVTIWDTAPALMQLFADSATEARSAPFETIRLVMLSGDWIPLRLAEQLRTLCPNARTMSLGGATEVSIWSVSYPILTIDPRWTSVPYGRALANQTVYVLDPLDRPCPVGVSGHLHIGGVGVAMGYLNRLELSAEKFVPDPFNAHFGGRMYRTGDKARWMPDGNLEFLGRLDFQVKVRGYRIELGEIEARLLEHRAVRDAVVMVREFGAGDRRLVAYATLQADYQAAQMPEFQSVQVSRWQEIYETTYAQPSSSESIDDFAGWNSSYDARPIPEDEMREWQETTLERIRSFKPGHVLEIGCGSGLMLLRLAGSCTSYTGTDFSSETLAKLAGTAAFKALGDVRLLHRTAEDFSGIPRGQFDTILINSVIQYFPNVDYLLKVIDGALDCLAPNGRLFIGDVRNYRLVEAFHASTQLFRANDQDSLSSLRSRIQSALIAEKELLVDPDFFIELVERLPRLGSVQVLPKLGRSDNELTRFRYDAVLHVGPVSPRNETPSPDYPMIDWVAEGCSVSRLESLLSTEQPGVLLVRSIPNSRVIQHVIVPDMLQNDGFSARESVGGFRDTLENRLAPDQGIDTQSFVDLAHTAGYHTELSWGRASTNGSFHALLSRKQSHRDPVKFPSLALAVERNPNRAFTNDPLKESIRKQAVEDLKSSLGSLLPDYMVPAHFVFLDRLPLSPNGKLDRAALPAPEGAGSNLEFVAPGTSTERAVAAIWCEVLKVDRVGRNDHFFALGGHSLLAVQAVSRMSRALGVEIAVRDLFTRPTLAEFSRGITVASKVELPPITMSQGSNRLTLSFAQQRLWFLAQLEGVSKAYHIPIGLTLTGDLDRRALRKSLHRLVARHEALRTTFRLVDGEPVQHISSADDARFELVDHDLRRHSDSSAELRRLVELESDAAFNLERGPLIRGRLVRQSESEHVLLITMHHIVSDGWSMAVLVSELSKLYASFQRGEEDPLQPLDIQYPDYAAWQRRWITGDLLQTQADFWKKTLEGAPELLELPTDRPRPAHQDYAGGFAPFALDPKLSRSLKALSQRHGTTLYMTLLAAWGALLGRLSGQDNLVIGTPTANRGRTEIESLIGFFVNTLALRLNLAGSPTVAEWLKRVKSQALAAQHHQDIPFEHVVEIVRPARSLSHSPIFQVMFAWQNAPEGALELPGLTLGHLAEAHDVTAKFDLLLSLSESGGTIQGGLEFASALFDRPTAERYLGHFRNLLQAMAADETCRIDELPILDAAERNQVLEAWNEADTSYPEQLCVHQLFEAQAACTPGAIAASHRGIEISYADLDARADRLAERLRACGIQPDSRVAICMERSLQMVVGVLAILKAGGAYVPLDPALPVDRIRTMLFDCAPAAVLTQTTLCQRFADLELPVIDSDMPAAASAKAPAKLEADPVRPEHLAYVIYTSGSTGVPKGVAVSHRALMNLLSWQIDRSGMKAGSSTLQFASLGFDVSFQEIFSTLGSGGRLVLIDEASRLDPLALVNLIQNEGIQRLFLPFVALGMLAEGYANATNDYRHIEGVHCPLEEIITAGEQLRIDSKVSRFLEFCGNCTLENQYGPTETHVVSSYRLPPRRDQWPVLPPIGRPISNARIYVLDSHGAPQPIGVAGELYLGGAAVARGYLDRPELTAERFLDDPFSGRTGARMYKTGDLGRWLSDGNIEFLGRNDFQVKVRGFRVEPGEIEAVLSEHPAVHECVVIARDAGPGAKRLLAYYTGNREAVGADALRSHLLETLPDYMVPAAFVWLESLPITCNGKVDRKALPDPESEAFASHGYEAPIGLIENALASIWAELLKIDRVGRNDNFFELGGHSLLVIQVLSRLRKLLGVEARLGDLFAFPCLADFARCLERAEQTALPPVTRAEGAERLALSFAQRRLWFLCQLDGVSEAYHLPMGLTLTGELDRVALRKALDAIVDRHETLRTTFDQIDGIPFQKIAAPGQATFHLHEHDFRGLENAADRIEHLDAIESATAFDLGKGPLIRGRLVRQSEQVHTLLITMHHIVSDGWSIGLLMNELSALYTAFLTGDGNPLAPLEIQYADYGAWQRRWISGDLLKKQAAFWKATLAGAPERIDLPTDRPRPADQSYKGAFMDVSLEADLVRNLKILSQRHGVTLHMTLMAAWGTLLSRLSGQQDLVIGTPSANRGRSEVEGLIGLFINTLALRMDLSGSPTVVDLLQRVRTLALAAQQHQDIPFEQVVEVARPVRSLAHSPIFQVLFSWQNTPEGRLELPGLLLTPRNSDTHSTSQFDLSLFLQEEEGRIVGGIAYATALFDQSTIQRHFDYLRILLEGMVADDMQAVDCIPMLPESERLRVVHEWNDTRVEFPTGHCIHELFESAAARSPDAIAVVQAEQQLRYGELNARANQLAHHLRGLGVGPDSRVAICTERGFGMVVGLLAILKAGGAYVPLDPSYPVDRLRFMLTDSDPVALLVQAGREQLFDGLNASLPVLDLDVEAAWSHESRSNPGASGIGLKPSHLAYVIYTSGSTGHPKGVMNEHAAVVNRLLWMQQAYGLGADDCVLQKTSFSFDVSVWEFFWPLFTGARLMMAHPQGHKDPDYLAETIQRKEVTTLHFVPSMLQAFLSHHDLAKCDRLIRVICSGEALPASLARQFHERLPGVELHNLYGPTEAAVDVTAWECKPGVQESSIPIGRPIANTRMYVLDSKGQPTPVGVPGEIHIGGVQVARGYLNRPELTAERFVHDPFAGIEGARMYRTGDLGCWLSNGAIDYLGRNDFQVKVRGFRIELGEIEARIAELQGVLEAVVLLREDNPGDKRLVAYYTCVGDSEAATISVEAFHAHLGAKLPDHMIPAAFVQLESLPLSPNGKLDRRALPAPTCGAYSTREFEAPQGEIEEALAEIWTQVIGVPVGRNDNFFQLGGHSLLAITVIDRMRRKGLHADVRALFTTTSLAGLATAVGGESPRIEVPPNRIPQGCSEILPEMLSLIDLSSEEIAIIVAGVHGGASNIQDIYPLAPLQEGILFHHQMGNEGDPYLQSTLYSFDTRARLDLYLEALQQVMSRHDVLRTAVIWEGLHEPVQVVWRKAPLSIHEVTLDAGDGDLADRLREAFAPGRMRLDVRHAPMMQAYIAHDRKNERWLLVKLAHHLLGDHTMLEVLDAEIEAHLLGRAETLSPPLPFRNLVAHARLGISQHEHEAFFRNLLRDVEEPTLPFGLLDVQGDGHRLAEAEMDVDPELALRLRECARRLGVSAASLCHVAWAQVLARVSGPDDVVFGTVVFGRMQGGDGADRVMGLFINTLPIRIAIGEASVESSVRRTHALLADLMRHEHAPLALAQRCSGVRAPAPLFSSLLNYRHGSMAQTRSAEAIEAWRGIESLHADERSNYPLSMSVNDMGVDFSLSVQVDGSIDPMRICAFMRTALDELAGALESSPGTAIRDLDVLPAFEQARVVHEWNSTRADFAHDKCINEMFEAQVLKAPLALALVHEGKQVSYADLNARANQLAHHLQESGVVPDSRVAICTERGIDMVVAMLAVLKAGGAYVPMDPAYPVERLRYLLQDSSPAALILQAGNDAGLATNSPGLPVIRMGSGNTAWAGKPVGNLDASRIGLAPDHLAYVIYTSGSTGTPKGVMVEHRQLANLVQWHQRAFELREGQWTSSVAGVGFDATAWEIWPTLLCGATLALAPAIASGDPELLLSWWSQQQLAVSFLPTPLAEFAFARGLVDSRKGTVLIGGDRLRQMPSGSLPFDLVNNYGPTETTVVATSSLLSAGDGVIHIGRPIANAQVYILDAHGRPAPIGVAGEIHIGGSGVARGYLNRPELTREKFAFDPFSSKANARMYRSGDLGRWLPNGTIEFLGRNDQQVKIRGFRIELGEIEARLLDHPGIREAVVSVREDNPGDRRLVAYYTVADTGQKAGSTVDAILLKAHLGGTLPDVMVPSAYVRLEALPLTPNGKLDRRALPAPETDAYATSGFEAPEGETEIALAALWAEILGIGIIGRNDNFFELGGHSLAAGKLVLRINQAMEVELSLRAVFETSELAAMAELIVDAQLAQFDPDELAAFAETINCTNGTGIPYADMSA